MSYRALISIVQGDDQRDYKIVLDEDFKNGEELSHVIADQRMFGKAILHLAGGVYGPVKLAQTHWDTLERAQWVSDYADQWWVVNFEPDGEYVKVDITGSDAGDRMVFFRRRVYHVGPEQSEGGEG